jgi:hypothetical protein
MQSMKIQLYKKTLDKYRTCPNTMFTGCILKVRMIQCYVYNKMLPVALSNEVKHEPSKNWYYWIW